MRRALPSLLLVASFTGLALASVSGTTPPLGPRHHDPELHAFVHARIVVRPGRVIEDGLLVVKGERIVTAGEMGRPPEGAAVHDLSGKTIYPGFIDPYTKYGRPEAPAPEKGASAAAGPKYEATRHGPSAWNEAVHAEKRWADAFVPDPAQAKPFLERGVTVVGSARLDGIFRGRGFAATLAEGLPIDVRWEAMRPYVRGERPVFVRADGARQIAQALEPGKDATLLVSEGNLLDHLGRRVTLQFIEGRRVDLANRHERLRHKYRDKPVPAAATSN